MLKNGANNTRSDGQTLIKRNYIWVDPPSLHGRAGLNPQESGAGPVAHGLRRSQAQDIRAKTLKELLNICLYIYIYMRTN